jgi:hypothetical protein
MFIQLLMGTVQTIRGNTLDTLNYKGLLATHFWGKVRNDAFSLGVVKILGAAACL